MDDASSDAAPADPDACSRPLRADAERNRLRILAAAREVFMERGLGVTMDDIAAHAGVGVGTVYRRFPDRSHLIDALFEERMREILAVADEGLAMDDPWEGLVHFLTRSQELQAVDQGLKEMLVSAGGAQHRVDRMRTEMAPRMFRLIGRARDAGRLRPDFEPFDMPLLQVMLGTVVDFSRDVQPDAWRRVLAIVIDGMRASDEARTPLDAPPLSADRIATAMVAWGSRRR
ncbi:MAG: TetR/AcrR family transcriptional regulator [Solirubrobacteraceae bacterium]